MDFKLELIGVPVSDVDRAKAFYVDQAGFVLDHDHRVSEDIRFVQLTPPGSACSIAIGKGLTGMAPGALDALQVVVADIHEARAELVGRGVDVTEVIIATDPNTEGEATATYLVRMLRDIPGLTVTRIASGLPMGGDLEFADELTLGRALAGRRAMA